jgi:hypothetical protein
MLSILFQSTGTTRQESQHLFCPKRCCCMICLKIPLEIENKRYPALCANNLPQAQLGTN